MKKKYFKHPKPKKAGVIKLFFNDKFVTALQFQYPARRKEIIENWERQYQIKKRDSKVFYQIRYDEN